MLRSRSYPGVFEIILRGVSIYTSLLLKHTLVMVVWSIYIAFGLVYYWLFLLLGIINFLFQLTTYKHRLSLLLIILTESLYVDLIVLNSAFHLGIFFYQFLDFILICLHLPPSLIQYYILTIIFVTPNSSVVMRLISVSLLPLINSLNWFDRRFMNL